MRVYLASSWRNAYQPEYVQRLRAAGHEVYDFRHPEPGNEGFSWAELDPLWKGWTSAQFIDALEKPPAAQSFKLDMDALKWADAVVLAMPCGRSSHLELGYAAGAGKGTAIVLEGGEEPELMYKMADLVAGSFQEAIEWLNVCEVFQR